jgi:hypothetical protein
MLAIVFAATLTALVAEDVQAASNELRANSALVTGELEHATSLFTCITRKLKASPPSKSADVQQQYLDYRMQMSASAERCGVAKEREFWAASLKAAYPGWSGQLAQEVATQSLDFFIFDSAMSGP